MLHSVSKHFLAIAAVTCLMANGAFAQQTTQPATVGEVAPATTMLTAEGELSGTILSAINAEGQPTQVPNAKVVLVSQGKVIDTVTANEAGVFSFKDIHPGDYQVVSSSGNLVGSQAFKVASFSKQPAAPAAAPTVVLQPSAPEVVYDNLSSAPVSSFSSAPTYSASPSYGGGGRIGGRLGGRLGGRMGGLLSGRRAALLGLSGLAFIDSNDASPDE